MFLNSPLHYLSAGEIGDERFVAQNTKGTIRVDANLGREIVSFEKLSWYEPRVGLGGVNLGRYKVMDKPLFDRQLKRINKPIIYRTGIGIYRVPTGFWSGSSFRLIYDPLDDLSNRSRVFDDGGRLSIRRNPHKISHNL